jgi:serpin B
MKTRLLALLTVCIAIALLLSACQPYGGKQAHSRLDRIVDPEVAASDVQELVKGNTGFALDMYREVHSPGKNIFFSPYSISLALAMAYAGARGDTESQMATSLHFSLAQSRLHPAFNALDQELKARSGQVDDDQPDPQFVLSIANSLWGQSRWPFLPEYVDLLALNYGAGMRLVDFTNEAEQARKTINDWVSDETKDKVKDLLPEGVVDYKTRLVLVNAIYFKAGWEHGFAKSSTKEAPFTLLNGDQVNVPMMNYQEAERLPYASGEGWQAVSMPYQGGKVAMVVLLPDIGKFEEFEAGLTGKSLALILASMDQKSVLLSMPKFTLTCDYLLGDVLAEMGMPLAFDRNLADLSGIDGKKGLYIQEIIHKAFVNVDEEGTEAAAATGIVIAPASLPITEVEMKVDHPFIFMIRDVPTGSILFLGRVLDPGK